MARVTKFEGEVQQLLDEYRLLIAKAKILVLDSWLATFEGVYNGEGVGADDYVGGILTQSQMNNAITAIENINTQYETDKAAVNNAADATG